MYQESAVLVPNPGWLVERLRRTFKQTKTKCVCQEMIELYIPFCYRDGGRLQQAAIESIKRLLTDSINGLAVVSLQEFEKQLPEEEQGVWCCEQRLQCCLHNTLRRRVVRNGDNVERLSYELHIQLGLLNIYLRETEVMMPDFELIISESSVLPVQKVVSPKQKKTRPPRKSSPPPKAKTPKVGQPGIDPERSSAISFWLKPIRISGTGESNEPESDT